MTHLMTDRFTVGWKRRPPCRAPVHVDGSGSGSQDSARNGWLKLEAVLEGELS